MAVTFKGTSEYKSKFKGRSARSRSASPQLRTRKAGLRSDQLGVVREPQFLSKRRVPLHRPQVYRSFQWEDPDESPWERQNPRASAAPAPALPVEGPGKADGPETPLAPRGPKPSRALCAESEPVAAAPPPPPPPPPPTEPRRPVTAGEAGPVPNGVHHVLKRRAGLKLVGRSNKLQSSEYQRQFQCKTPVASSPLLAAEQMVYRSSPVIPPFRATPLVQESEYRRSFKGSPPPRAPRLRLDLEQREGPQSPPEPGSPERATKGKKKKKKLQLRISRKPSLQSGGPRREVRSQSPSHGGYWKVKSEYSSHFRSPLHYRLSDGVWVKSSTAAEEAQELRKRAEAYRRRAWGTHFSRDHLNQIQSEQNRLWEASTASDGLAESSRTIQALDLASIESLKGSSSEGRSLPPSPGRGSSAGGSTEARRQNAPTLPVRRRLAWGREEEEEEEEEEGRNRREEPGEEPPGEKKRAEEEEEEEVEDCRSDKATASENPSPSPASASQGSGTPGGRLPTPKMKTVRTVQRTHHDRTTPTTGGAILVSPPKATEGSPGRGVRRSEPPLGKPYSPYKALSRASPERRSSKVEGGSPPAAGLTTADPIPLREDPWPSRPSPNNSPAPRPAGRGPALPAAPAPLPTNRIHGRLRDPEFQHNGDLGFLRHETTAFPSSELSDDDDRMSQISSRSAASCSLASQVLERAQKRHKSFWGKH